MEAYRYIHVHNMHLVVKQYDFSVHWFSTNGALGDLVSTQLTCAMTTEKCTVLLTVHTNMALGL